LSYTRWLGRNGTLAFQAQREEPAMISQRTLSGLVFGLAVATAATAQTNTALRWRTGATPIGLQMQLAPSDDSAAWRLARAKTSAVSVIGRTEYAPDLGFYGRFGTTSLRPVAGFASPQAGTTYGVGVSWEFSRSGSASLGWDSYDLRTATGEPRDIRATSLGLQWRY
jgi:OmpA-OmpF porin, OOP family